MLCTENFDALQASGKGLLPEVVAFEEYASEYGPFGNWNADDHKEFLHILKENKGDYAATVLECCHRMIGYDRLDIIAHARWHSGYEERALCKKMALHEWKRSKEVQAEAHRKEAATQLNSAVTGLATDPAKCAHSCLGVRVPCCAWLGRMLEAPLKRTDHGTWMAHIEPPESTLPRTLMQEGPRVTG